MFFKHSKNGSPKCDKRSNGSVSRFPESPVNPMYKPRTLGELRALFDHTGINPAPVQLREGVPDIDGLDPMDTPPIPIGGDTFERIRTAKQIEKELRDNENRYRANQEFEKTKEVEKTQAE